MTIKDASSQRIRVIDPGEESKTPFIDLSLADFFDSVNGVPSQELDENGEPLASFLIGVDVFAAQKEAVRKQYVGSALWLKAPNGVQTNLAEGFTVKETTNAGHKIYSVQMLELKKSAGTLPRSAVKRSSATADLSAISIAELADKYNPLFDRVDVIEKDTDLSTNPDPKSGREKSTSFIEHSITQCWNDVNSLKIAGDVDENGEPLASSLMGRERTRYKKSRPQAICGVGSVAESAEWRAGESHGRAMAHSAHTYVQGAIWRLGRGI